MDPRPMTVKWQLYDDATGEEWSWGWQKASLSPGDQVTIKLKMPEVRRNMMKVGGEANPPRDVKCPHCGQVVPYDNLCSNCGKPLS